ncbi:membrane protein [Streptomyces sp. XY593]|nr:membrane protein [Streptomyces sp. XY593]
MLIPQRIDLCGKDRNEMTYKKAVVLAAGALMAAGAASPAMADSTADALAAGSPGVLSGNAVQVPVHIPVNVCGNSVNIVGLLNPTFGNTCVNA